MNKKLFVIVMASLLQSRGLLAEEPVRNYDGEEVVVTATKTMNTISNAGGSSVTVITAEDIRRSGQNSVQEVMKGVPGLDIVSNGGMGSITTLSVRGADSKNTLVLIDGVSVNDAANPARSANISNLTVDNIERIEVVRGPLSVLYGSNATAGVINIITRKGDGPLRLNAGTEGGAYGTWKVYGGGSGKTGQLGYSASVARLKTDGFSFADNRNPDIPHAGNTSEKDGYQNTTASLGLSWDFSTETVLETTFRYTDASVKYDDNANGYTGDRFDYVGFSAVASPNLPKDQHNDSRLYTGRVALKNKGEKLATTLFYQFNGERREDYSNDNVKTTAYRSANHEAGWQGDFSVTTSNTLTFGLSGARESIVYDDYQYGAPTIDKGLSSWNIWMQDQWKTGPLNLVGGVRYEDHETFGDKVTWRVAPSLTFGNTVLKTSYATGFLSPSLYQLYSEYGSTALKPETSRGWDVGVQQRFHERLRGGVTWFNTVFEDRIDFDMVTWKYSQAAGKTSSKGLESFIEWTAADPLQFVLNYTYNKTKDPVGNQLVRRPENKVGLGATWHPVKASSLNVNMQWVDDRKEVASARDKNGNPVGSLSSYVLVNLAGSYKLSSNVELYGRIDNVFDKYYEEAWAYATPGRSAYAGVKVTY